MYNWPPAARSAARYIGVLRKRKANAPPGTTPTNLGDAFFRPVPLVLARLSQSLRKMRPRASKSQSNHCVKCVLGLPSCKAITFVAPTSNSLSYIMKTQ